MPTTTDAYRPTQRKLMLQDLADGLRGWRIWLLLSWQDIRLRYRRSQLGPFWLTLSMAITIYAMGYLYGHLFKLDIRNYFPFLAAGMLTWYLIALVINDCTNAFMEAENYIRQMKLPYSVFVLRVLSRSLIIFLHNIIVMIPLYFVFHIKLTPAFLLIFPCAFLIAVNGYFYGIVLAIIGARFRDLGQLITSVIQIIFFMTPVMWNPTALPEKYRGWLILNPFAQYVEILRAPLTSQLPKSSAVMVVLLLTFVGAGLAFWMFTRVRHRIVYWL